MSFFLQGGSRRKHRQHFLAQNSRKYSSVLFGTSNAFNIINNSPELHYFTLFSMCFPDIKTELLNYSFQREVKRITTLTLTKTFSHFWKILLKKFLASLPKARKLRIATLLFTKKLNPLLNSVMMEVHHIETSHYLPCKSGTSVITKELISKKR